MKSTTVFFSFTFRKMFASKHSLGSVCGCAIGGDRQIFATKITGVAVSRPILLQQVVQETKRSEPQLQSCPDYCMPLF